MSEPFNSEPSPFQKAFSFYRTTLDIVTGIGLLATLIALIAGLSLTTLLVIGLPSITLTVIVIFGHVHLINDKPFNTISAWRDGYLGEADRTRLPETESAKTLKAPAKVLTGEVPKPNIICMGVDDDLSVELDRHETFRLSQHDFALRALTVKFSNQSRPPDKIGPAQNVGAQILFYEKDRPGVELFRVNHVCWLTHESPLITVERDIPQWIVLGVFEPKPTGGFEPRVTFYENHLDQHAPLVRHPYGKPYENFLLKLRLNAGEYGEFGSEHEFELKVDYGSSWNFKHLTEGKKPLPMIRVTERRIENAEGENLSTLDITYEPRSPFTTETVGNSGIQYKTRTVAITSPVAGKVSLKIPMLSIGKANYPNVYLRPIPDQPDELEAGETGYWHVVQMNTHENQIRLMRKGNEKYPLGTTTQFALEARCKDLVTRKLVTAKIEGGNLLFKLSDKSKDDPTLSTPDLQGKIICLDTKPTLTPKFSNVCNDCFLTILLRVTNESPVPTMVSRWQADLLWENVEYPSVRNAVEDYYVKHPSPHPADSETKYETEWRPLNEFPNNEEITNTNYKVGYLRFSVGSLPSQAIAHGRRLQKEVILKLQAFDSKDNPHLIYEDTTEGLSGCGTIRRPGKMMRFRDTEGGSVLEEINVFED